MWGNSWGPRSLRLFRQKNLSSKQLLQLKLSSSSRKNGKKAILRSRTKIGTQHWSVQRQLVTQSQTLTAISRLAGKTSASNSCLSTHRAGTDSRLYYCLVQVTGEQQMSLPSVPGTGWALRSFPTQAMLWFCDSMKWGLVFSFRLN